MKVTINKEQLIRARNRAAYVVSTLIKDDKTTNTNVALDYFVIVNVLNGLINSDYVAFSEDGLIYIDLGGDENARREESASSEVPGHISGTDEQNQGDKDGQEEVAPDSAD